MARIARIVLPNKPHLLRHGGDWPMFRSAKRRRAYLDLLAELHKGYSIKLLAWSVLPSESTLLVVPPSPRALSSFMRVLQARFARLVHAAGSKREVTTRRFASCALDAAAAADAIKLIEQGPVRARLAASAGEYEFSSAAVRCASGNHSILATDPAVNRKIGRYGDWIAEPLDDDRREYLELRLRTGKPAGEPAFIRRIEKRLGRNLSRPPGRPPKSA